MAITRRPLLAVDGNSFAHRAYHALPKSIRRRGNQGGGAIVGFANLLLRLYEDEQPRAVLVGWDTLDAPTYRHDALEGYQGGRRFDAELIDQLECCRSSWPPAASLVQRRPATRPTISSRRPWLTRRGAAALSSSQAVIAMRFSWPRTGRRSCSRCGPARWRASDRRGCSALRRRARAGARLHRPAWRSLGQAAGCQGCRTEGCGELLRQHGTLEQALEAGELAGQADELRLYRRIATMDGAAPLPPLPDQTPTWTTAADLARSWELNRLAERLAALAQSA